VQGGPCKEAGRGAPPPVALDIEPPTSAMAAAPSELAGKLVEAERLRAQGNEHFKAGEFGAAKKAYKEALKLLPEAPPEGPLGAKAMPSEGSVPFEAAKACRIPSQLNLALCCLRDKPPEAGYALELCEAVLYEEPDNAKATYRKGKALLELGELLEAEYELSRACKLAPKDPTARQDLEKLRQRIRENKQQEKKICEGIFAKGSGFASDGRAEASVTSSQSTAKEGHAYAFLKKPEENPFGSSEDAAKEAVSLQKSGRLEEAIWALEAAVRQAEAKGECNGARGHWLELGRFFMDLNVDRLALACLTRCVDMKEASSDDAEETVEQRNALLLSAICLLNEAEGDPLIEVCRALSAWLAAHGRVPRTGSSAEADVIQDELQQWRHQGAGADAAVAHGLLHLVRGDDACLVDFAVALQAPEHAGPFFSNPARRATKWNMLGAVLSNRGRREHALIAYEQALKQQPHYPRALLNQGIAHDAMNEHVKAITSCALALRVVPDWAQYDLWALIRKAAGQSGDAALAEAAREGSLGKLCGVLEFPQLQSETTLQAPGEVLVRIGLASGPQTA